LPEELLKNPNYLAGQYGKALREVFLKMDEMLNTEEGKDEIHEIYNEKATASSESPTKKGYGGLTEEGPDMKGCTANVILIKNKTLFVANAGDSRCIVAGKGKATELSFDHKPDGEKELARITKAGGSVTEGRVEGNLNLSRSLGDLRYKIDKKLKPEEQIISGEPDIFEYEIKSEYDFIVMGCDGVYETKSNQQIVEFFYKELKGNPALKPAVENFLDSNVSPDYIKTEGAGCDNMTCILVQFKKIHK